MLKVAIFIDCAGEERDPFRRSSKSRRIGRGRHKLGCSILLLARVVPEHAASEQFYKGCRASSYGVRYAREQVCGQIAGARSCSTKKLDARNEDDAPAVATPDDGVRIAITSSCSGVRLLVAGSFAP
jgi:hypothetical protein